ncbi:TPA: M48 family metalloprotease [archaeon]|uniref:Protease HtpX homolog n=1 Tax=Candidatus Naiadarchaeum limnaeum TaxID=2756139 RepID=A0A832X5X5_9ARCH|nr:M48 family metalloprotease [Candidatus Naiadarchaeum limnaeum]
MGSTRIVLLFGLLIGIFMLVGSFFGTYGIITALIFAALINVVSYFYSDKIVLAMYGAKEVSAHDYPKLHHVVERLAKKAKIPKPKVAVMQSATPNAFATGRNPKNAVVCATTGILNLLNENELEGVFAHEISHITNKDILVGTVAATIAGAIALIGRFAYFAGSSRDRGGNALMFLIFIIVAPLAAALVRMAISRQREYGADYSGAILSEKPLALASALQKISAGVKHHPLKSGSPATSHLFIVNPFAGESLIHLFLTHPPLEKRIERLKSIKV